MDCHKVTDDQPAADRQTTEVEEKLSALARLKSDHRLGSCGEEPDIDALVRFATSPEGLVNDEVRRKVCTFTERQKPCDCVLIRLARALATGLQPIEESRVYRDCSMATSTTSQGRGPSTP